MNSKEAARSGLVDYAARQCASFDNKPFCIEDSMVLSQLAYLDYSSVVPPAGYLSRAEEEFPVEEVGAGAGLLGRLSASIRNYRLPKRLPTMTDLAMPDVIRQIKPGNNLPLIEAAAINPRFWEIRLRDYVSLLERDSEKQFSAVCFELPDGTDYISIRGTDSTLTGWRENLTMAYRFPVPAQSEALNYLVNNARSHKKRIRIGGHSKGGNLAVYAAVFAPEEIRRRIAGVYSLDGPGFKEKVFATPGFKEISSKMHKVLPVDSMIGTLLLQNTSFTVVNSSEKGINQHSLYSWEFEKGHLSFAGSLTPAALCFDLTFDKWLQSMSDARRKQIIEIMFYLMDRTGAETLQSLLSFYQQGKSAFRGLLSGLEQEKRGICMAEFARLAAAYLQARRELVKRGEY